MLIFLEYLIFNIPQIAGEELTHLGILQSGLASSDLLQDCLAVAKVGNISQQNIFKL